MGQPDEPELILPEDELWDSIAPHIQSIWLHNRQEWEDFYDDATGRIKLHDEGMD